MENTYEKLQKEIKQLQNTKEILNNRIENLRYATPHLNSVNRKTKYTPRRTTGNFGWEVTATRNGKNYRKYFTNNKYQEAIEFCLVLDEVREDTDRIKELFTLII